MAKKAPRTKNKDNARRSKKKTSVLVQENVEYIDYKDVNLLRRFMSDRAKIRARRVTGNDAQQQREVARAIKNAREMALLPYTNRVTTQRTSRDRAAGGPGRADGPPPRPSARRPSPTSSTRWRPRRSKPAPPVPPRTTDEGDPARRRRQRRQEGRHRRRRRRLRTQLPGAEGSRAARHRGQRRAGGVDAPRPRHPRREGPQRGRGGREGARSRGDLGHREGGHRGPPVRLGHLRRRGRRGAGADRHRTR